MSRRYLQGDRQTKWTTLSRLCLLGIFFLVVKDSTAQESDIRNRPDQSSGEESFAVIEIAEYRVKYSAGDFVDGSFRWDLLHRGSGTSEIELTDSNLAMTDLKTSLQDIAWGTTQQGRRIVIVNPETSLIDGQWSLHGRRYPGRTVFDCQFPPSLNSRLIIKVPTDLKVICPLGIAESRPIADEPRYREWTIELGRHKNTSISVVQGATLDKVVRPKVDVEAVYVARQDGFFIQTDFAIEGLSESKNRTLQIETSSPFNIQAVSSNGIPLDFVKDEKNGKSLSITLPVVLARNRINIRVQGFKPVRWVRPHTLILQTIEGAIETQRSAILRVESPLEVHSIEQEGFFQSGLTESTRGEILKFDAFQANPKLVVDLGLPKTSLKVDIHSLHYLDTPLPWVLSKVNCSVKSGRLFRASYSLPQEWTIVSVKSSNTESEISAWNVEKNQLEIFFKRPIAAEFGKAFEVLARTKLPIIGQASAFPVLRANDTTNGSTRSDWILPPNWDLDLSTNSRWTQLTSQIDLQDFADQLTASEKTKRQNQRSFFNSNSQFDTASSVRYISKVDDEINKLEVDDADLSTSVIEPDPERQTSVSFGQLHLLTQADSLGDVGTPRLVHHATIQFPGPISPAQLGLKLSQRCQLASVSVNDQAATVIRKGELILFPETVTAINRLNFVYVTDSQRQFLSENCTIPLPTADIPFSHLNWTLEVPDSRKLSQVDIPGIKFEAAKDRFFFGPLTSEKFAAGFFNRSRSKPSQGDWKNGHSNSHGNFQRYQFYTIQPATEVSFCAWNITQAINLSWSAFFACMIFGIGGRLSNTKMIRKISPYWLLCLFGLQAWAANEYSMITGAMLAGTLISTLLPFEFLRLPLKNPFSLPKRQLSTASLLCCLLVGLAIPSATTLSEEADRASGVPVRYLLRSVRYQSDSADSRLFRAKIEVLTHRSDQETLVELPYQGIVFQSGAECLVDGLPQTLIPAVSGKGVIVRIPKQLEAEEDASSANWQTHSIQFEFSLRDGELYSTTQSDQVRFPTVQDAVLVLNQNSLFSPLIEPQKYRRLGQLDQFQNGEIKVSLGPVDSFVQSSPVATAEATSLASYTLLNVSAARLSGQTYIQQPSNQTKRSLVLSVPKTIFVTTVSGPNIAQWFKSLNASGQESLIIEYKEGATERNTAISFHAPAVMTSNQEVIIPKLDWGLTHAQHYIGIKTPNGVTVEQAGNQPPLDMIGNESWPRNAVFGRTVPQFVFEAIDSEVVKFVLKKVVPVPDHTISEKITVERNKISWEAHAEIRVAQIPLFVHRFKLSGGLRINRVLSAESEIPTQFRYFQNGDELSIFIPGGQIGAKKYVLFGDKQFAPETTSRLPGIAMIDSQLIDGKVSLYDQTNWQIELLRDDEVFLTKNPETDDKISANRLVSEYSSEDKTNDLKLRLLPPPSATRVDIATRIHVDRSREWNCVQLLHFSGSETPLKTIAFQVPKSLKSVRIGPRYFRTKTKELESSIEYTIPIPERFADEVTIQVYSKLPADFINKLLSDQASGSEQSIPDVRILSARIVSQFLFFNQNNSVVAPALESSPVERKNLPKWAPLQWQEAVASLQLNAFQITSGEPALIAKAMSGTYELPKLHFVESTVWPSDRSKDVETAQSNSQNGLSRLWITGPPRFTYQVPFSDEIAVTRVASPLHGTLELEKNEDGVLVEVDNFESQTPLIIYWNSKSSTIKSPLKNDASKVTRQVIRLVAPPSKDMPDAVERSFESLLYRWQSLLQFANSLQVPIAIESPLYRELIELDSVSNSYLLNDELSTQQQQLLYEAVNEWKSVSEKLTISAAPVLTKIESKIAESDLIEGPGNEFQSVSWFFPDADNQLRINWRNEKASSSWAIHIARILCITVCLALIIRFRKTLEILIAEVRGKPVLRLLMLGVIWLFFFQPIAIGLLFIVLAFVVQISRQIQPSLSREPTA